MFNINFEPELMETSVKYIKYSCSDNRRPRKFLLYLIFFVVLGALYGPKIGGYIDVSVSIYALIFLFLLAKKKVKIAVDSIFIFMILILSFLYILSVSIAAGVPDYYPLMRGLRSIIATFCLAFIFYTITSSGEITVYSFIKLIISSLTLLSSIMILQVLFPALQPFFAEIYGFNKSMRTFRAFGLTAGYDTAGYLAAFNSIFALIFFVLMKKRTGLIVFFLSAAAVMFSSRSSIMLFLGLFFLSLFVLLFLKFRYTLKMLLPLVGVIIIVAIFVLPLFFSTFTFFNHFGNYSQKTKFDYTSQYAKTDIIQGYLANHWLLPDSYENIFWGTGQESSGSDVGYIKLIFMGGLAYLILIILFYSSLYFFTRYKIKRCLNMLKGFEYNSLLVLYFSVSIFFLIIMLGNLKNLYFLTRAYHELFIILCFSAIGFCHHYKRKFWAKQA